jgi:two-component system cell cycle sensor histidine kinase/response regulator CckA
VDVRHGRRRDAAREDAVGDRGAADRHHRDAGAVGVAGAAADGWEALSARERGGKRDVLVTDVVMPGLSGPRLAAAVKAQRPQLPVLFVSGYPSEELGQGGMLPGGAFLPKPFHGDALVDTVRRLLEQG